MQAHSIYIHIPFCRHRCGYCDFNTYAGLDSLIPAYLAALQAEMAQLASAAPQRLPVHTIFFGGGTPSLLPASGIAALLKALEQNFNLLPELEITLEANPGTLTLPYLQELAALGVNRLSLGMQSARPEELRLLEREHRFEEVIQAVRWARQAGFQNLNLDLIYGLPEQTLAEWQFSLEQALRLQTEHLSLYALTLEHGTPFGAWARRGLLSEPDPEVAADMYEWARDRLAEAGFYHYEISNWARAPWNQTPATTENPGFACRHNLQYWRNLPYLGLGAGAHGYAAGRRTANVLSPQVYIQRLLEPADSSPPPFPLTFASQSGETISSESEIGETMMMGLRLVREGVSCHTFRQRFGKELRASFGPQIERLTRLQLLEWAGDPPERLRLTRRGHLLGNQVFMEFL